MEWPPPRLRGTPLKRAPKPVPTASNPAAAKVHAPTRPAPATQPKPKTAAKQQPNPISAPRLQPAAKPKPKPKPGATTAARARPPEDVLYDVRPQPSPARRQQHPARRPPTLTDAAATTFIAERAAAEARRTSSRHLSKPAPQAHGPPSTRPERRQGPPAVSPPPYQPSMTALIQRMPRYRRRRKSRPTPRRRLCAHTPGSTSARARTPRALPRYRNTRNPPGPPPPPVPTTPSHPPTPTPPPKTAAPPRDSGGSAGPTNSSGSCEGGSGESPLSRAWSTGPARGRWRTAASGQQGGG